jgi:chemotaxis protein MotB
MGRANKQAESDEAPGAPEWMVTFSDCMTLLLTFFVLLLSFSSFDNRVFKSLKVVYARAHNSITPTPRRSERDALLYLPPVKHVAEPDKGSEKPTLAQQLKEGLMKETELMDARRGMTFQIPSKQVFWGKGILLSPEGHQIMDILASFLDSVPNRVVISENGSTDSQSSMDLGLARAWAIMEYLTAKKDFKRERLSISATNTSTQGIPRKSELEAGHLEPERTVEIVLLERSIYN